MSQLLSFFQHKRVQFWLVLGSLLFIIMASLGYAGYTFFQNRNNAEATGIAIAYMGDNGGDVWKIYANGSAVRIIDDTNGTTYYDLTVDSNKNLYALNNNLALVRKYTPAGNLVTSFGYSGISLSKNNFGNRIYSKGWTNTNFIYEINGNANTAQLHDNTITTSTAVGTTEVNSVNGRVYNLMSGTGEIYETTAAFTTTKKWTLGQVCGVNSSMAMDTNGFLYAPKGNTGVNGTTLVKINPAVPTTFTDFAVISGAPGCINSIRKDNLNNLYVTASGSARIWKVTAAGVVTQLADLTAEGATSVGTFDAGPDGTVYAFVNSTAKLVRIDPAGNKVVINSSITSFNPFSLRVFDSVATISTSVSPNNGSILGGQTVTISGNNIQNDNFSLLKETTGTGGDQAFDQIAEAPDGSIVMGGKTSGTNSYDGVTFTSNGDSDAVLFKVDKKGSLLWVKTWGGVGADNILSVKVSSDGDIFVGGQFQNTVAFGGSTYTSAGGHDGFVSKLNANGDFVWTNRVSSSSSVYNNGEFITGLGVDGTGNVYVTGKFEGVTTFFSNTTSTTTRTVVGAANDGFVGKINDNGATGTWLWVNQFGGNNIGDGSEGLYTDTSGNTYITGNTQGTATFGSTVYNTVGGVNDVYVSKLDTNGTWLWSTFAGGSVSESGYDVQADSAGNVFVGGSFNSPSVTFGSTVLTRSFGSSNSFLARLSPSGNWVWAKQFAGNSDWINDIDIDTVNSRIVSNHFFTGTAILGSNTYASFGNVDLATTWTDYSGNTIKSKQYGSSLVDNVGTVLVHSDGNVYVTALPQGSGVFGTLTTSYTGVHSVLAKIGGVDVKIGGYTASNITYVNSTTVTAVTPAHAAGVVDVVLNDYSGLNGSLYNAYTYNPPQITSISPNSGTTLGGTNVTITGYDFIDANRKGTIITSGNSHSLALRNDGTVFSWGLNTSGQLGDGTVTQRSTPVQVVGLTGVTSISAGGVHSLALKNDGTVWSWGSNNNGRLGDGTITDRSTPVQVVGLTGVTSISAGGSHSLAVRNDGTVFSWGLNTSGQLGDGTVTQRSTPVQVVGLTGVTSISAGGSHSLALKNDGTVWSWGSNNSGRLGDGTITDRSTPVQVVGLTGVISIAGGALHSLALRSDGTVRSWGWNANGQLGDGTLTNRSTPVQTSAITNMQIISSKPTITIGGAVCTNVNIISNTELTCLTPSSLPGARDVVGLYSGAAFGTLPLGYTYFNICSITSLTPNSGPTTGGGTVTVNGSGFSSVVTSVSAGLSHSLALRNDGTVWAWGTNNYGELGDGTTTQRLTAVQVVGLTDVTSISAGYAYSLALRNDGTVRSWGLNDSGQLGDGTTTNRLTPVQVVGLTGVTSIATGQNHSLALRNDGTVRSWGLNDSGQLGDGTTTTRLTPVQVIGLTGVISIDSGDAHSLALRNDGTVWSWGRNSNGQLGDGTTTTRLTPVQVIGLTGVISIAGGALHSLALRSDGTVWSWGINNVGQLGDGTLTQRLTPVQVTGLTGVTSIAGGRPYSLASRNDGTVRSWGANVGGQLGDGTLTQRLTPVQVVGLTGVISIDGGDAHSLALRNDGTVRSWGRNSNGQLGDGTTTQRLTAVQVTGLNSTPTITVGGVAATNVTVVSNTQITFTVPAGTVGAKDVVISGGNCGTPVTLVGGYTYITPPVQNSNITSTVCDTPRYVGETTSCVLTVDTNFSNYTGSVNVRVDAAGTAVSCNIPASGTTMTCAAVTLPGSIGSYQSQFNASGSGSVYVNGNIVNVIGNIVRTGLNLYYDADHPGSYSGTGQTVFDLGSGNRNGVLGLNNTVAADDPTFNGAGIKSFVLDGGDDFINTTLLSNEAVNLTYEAWFKRANNNPVPTNKGEYIFSSKINSNLTYVDLTLGSSNVVVTGSVRDTALNFQLANSNFKVNTFWQHAAVTYDAVSNIYSLYVNSSLHSQLTVDAATPDSSAIRIGMLDMLNENFDGEIAIARVYNRAINQAEIDQNFNADRARFGLNQASLGVTSVSSVSFGTTQPSTTSSTVNAILSNTTFTDRRGSFAPWTATLSSSNFVAASGTITADKLNVNPLVQNVDMGSGTNNIIGLPTQLTGAGIPITLLNNTNSRANGGGRFILSPSLTLTIPAYTQTGSYNATLVISVS